MIQVLKLYSNFYKAFPNKIQILYFLGNNRLRSFFSCMNDSLNLQLSLGLVGLSISSSLVAQVHLTLPPLRPLILDPYISVLTYIHHSWISIFCIVGSSSHATLLLIRDYNLDVLSRPETYILARLLNHKYIIISHLSQVSL